MNLLKIEFIVRFKQYYNLIILHIYASTYKEDRTIIYSIYASTYMEDT